MNTEATSSVINLNQKRFGNGDPVLCVHGLGANIFTWRHFVDPISKTNQLILVDLRGFGDSPKPMDNQYSIEQHADDIYQIIIGDDLRNLTLIGNSLGGAISLLVALRLCEQEPGRLSKLVLIDAGAYKEYLPGYLKLMRSFLGYLVVNLTPSKMAAKFVLRASYYDPSKVVQEQVEAYARPLSSPGGRHGLLQTSRQCVPANSDEIISKLNRITVPTLILWGKEDAVISRKVGELLYQALPDSRLEIFDDCGHIPQEELPHRTIESVARFINSTPGTG